MVVPQMIVPVRFSWAEHIDATIFLRKQELMLEMRIWFSKGVTMDFARAVGCRIYLVATFLKATRFFMQIVALLGHDKSHYVVHCPSFVVNGDKRVAIGAKSIEDSFCCASPWDHTVNWAAPLTTKVLEQSVTTKVVTCGYHRCIPFHHFERIILICNCCCTSVLGECV